MNRKGINNKYIALSQFALFCFNGRDILLLKASKNNNLKYFKTGIIELLSLSISITNAKVRISLFLWVNLFQNLRFWG